MSVDKANTATTPDAMSLNRALLVAIALFQGVALFWLKNSIEHDFWPHGVGRVELPLWTLVLFVPLLLLVVLTRDNLRQVVPVVTGLAVVLLLIAGYTGWQLEPAEYVDGNAIRAIFFASLVLLAFKVAIYLQARVERSPLAYGALFRFSWRNAILVGICGLFVLVFWGILALWGALFDAVGIELFRDLFRKDWFLIPALALANGLAFVIFRQLIGIVDTLSRILRALCLFLLPLLSLVSLLFLATLPFVGLQALWDTGHGTALVLWLQAMMLFFFNATFQDESHDSPYPVALQRFVGVALATLPVYTLIAAWGLGLRIEQYGLSVARCWAVVVIGLLGLFAAAYSINLIRFRDRALARFGRINVVLGLVVAALMVAVNTPLLDFRKLTVASQLARLESGAISAADFDIRYLAVELGRPGYLALEALQESAGDAFAERVADLYRSPPFEAQPLSVDEAFARMTTYPASLEVPPALRTAIAAAMVDNDSARRAWVLSPDLDGDGQGEWITLFRTPWDYTDARLWTENEEGWQPAWIDVVGDAGFPLMADALQRDEVAVEAPRWQLLRIGDVLLRIPE